MSFRDDFTERTKAILAARAGGLCSNPDCNAPTSGPHSDPTRWLNSGVAGHITAAAPGGPRYDPRLSAEERKSPENGIHLCQTCGKVVDSDTSEHTVEQLRRWKRNAEGRARKAQSRPTAFVYDELTRAAVGKIEEVMRSSTLPPPFRPGTRPDQIRRELQQRLGIRCELVLIADDRVAVALAVRGGPLRDHMPAVAEAVLSLAAVAPRAGVIVVDLIDLEPWAGSVGGACPAQWSIMVHPALVQMARAGEISVAELWEGPVTAFIQFTQRRTGAPAARRVDFGTALSAEELVEANVPPERRRSENPRFLLRFPPSKPGDSVRIVRPTAALRCDTPETKGRAALADIEIEVSEPVPTAIGTRIQIWYEGEEASFRFFDGYIDFIRVEDLRPGQPGTHARVEIQAREAIARIIDLPVRGEYEFDSLASLATALLGAIPFRTVNALQGGMTAIRSDSAFKVLRLLGMLFHWELAWDRTGVRFLPLTLEERLRDRRPTRQLRVEDMLSFSFEAGRRVRR